jgi:hypothetical protein
MLSWGGHAIAPLDPIGIKIGRRKNWEQRKKWGWWKKWEVEKIRSAEIFGEREFSERGFLRWGLIGVCQGGFRREAEPCGIGCYMALGGHSPLESLGPIQNAPASGELDFNTTFDRPQSASA